MTPANCDLVIHNPQDLIQECDGLFDLQEALIDSDIPTQVQVLDWARIPEAFHVVIEVAYVPLVAKIGTFSITRSRIW